MSRSLNQLPAAGLLTNAAKGFVDGLNIRQQQTLREQELTSRDNFRREQLQLQKERLNAQKENQGLLAQIQGKKLGFNIEDGGLVEDPGFTNRLARQSFAEDYTKSYDPEDPSGLLGFDVDKKPDAEKESDLLDYLLKKRKLEGLDASQRDLYKDWESNTTTKISRVFFPQYEKLKESAKAGTAQGDLSLIFAFMKMTDPQSVVRESEYAAAADTRGWFETAQQWLPKIQSGETLPPEQRQRFVNMANKFAKIQAQEQNKFDAYTTGKARNDYGYDNFKIERLTGRNYQDQAFDPKIKEYADQYSLDYNQAKKILEGRGYGK